MLTKINLVLIHLNYNVEQYSKTFLITTIIGWVPAVE